MSEETLLKFALPALAIPEKQDILSLILDLNLNLPLRLLLLLAREERILGNQDHFRDNPNQKDYSKEMLKVKIQVLDTMSHFHHLLMTTNKFVDSFIFCFAFT